MEFSVYLHVPFCVSKCHYCDFYSLGMGNKSIPEAPYVAALQREISRWQEALALPQARIDTVFWGGGTPSLFSAEAVAAVQTYLKVLGEFSPAMEATLELNPKTADFAKLQALREAGINRISMGLQTLHEPLLKRLGRAHSAEEALASLQLIAEAGFDNFNLDLMYGLPGQDMDIFLSTLSQLQEFAFPHVSAYGLIVEEGTPFHEEQKKGSLELPEVEEVIAMEVALHGFCEGRGLKRYEISNYAQPGRECRHNLHYWNYDPFIGLGAGGVSFVRREFFSEPFLRSRGLEPSREIYGYRLTNHPDLAGYLKNSSGWEGLDIEPILRHVAQGEWLMMGLRRTAGVDLAAFARSFGEPPPPRFLNVLERAAARGWLAIKGEGARLSPEGMELSNEIFQEFFGD